MLQNQKLMKDMILFFLGIYIKDALTNIKNGTYINLGSWIDKPCYGKFTDKFEIIDWN